MNRRSLPVAIASFAALFGLKASPAAAIPVALTAADWREIDTAPRGRKVLAGYRNALGNWRTITARYYPAGTLPNDDWDGEDDYAPEGWYEESETHETLLRTYEPPTHWMPLPGEPIR